jgi:hypothetical protein
LAGFVVLMRGSLLRTANPLQFAKAIALVRLKQHGASSLRSLVPEIDKSR